METHVRDHYNVQDLIKKIDAGLTDAGKDIQQLHIKDLALVDQLHTGGAQATLSLVKKTCINPEDHILDAGCGLGGSSRLLARTFGCRVTGIDLSASYIDAAQILSQRTGLSHKNYFLSGSILDLPWNNSTFEAVLCQHLLMNIKDKHAAAQEFFRVLKPGGVLMLHEIVQGDKQDLALPVPWAASADISFLVSKDSLIQAFVCNGFRLEAFVDATETGTRYWQKVKEFAQKHADTPRLLGPHLVFGPNARDFPFTMAKNFASGSIGLIEAVLKKEQG